MGGPSLKKREIIKERGGYFGGRGCGKEKREEEGGGGREGKNNL